MKIAFQNGIIIKENETVTYIKIKDIHSSKLKSEKAGRRGKDIQKKNPTKVSNPGYKQNFHKSIMIDNSNEKGQTLRTGI